MPTTISGKDGSFKVGVTEYCTVSWSVDAEMTEIDNTTSCGDGAEQTDFGTFKVRGTVTIAYDNTGTSLDDLKPGSTLSTVTLNMDGSKNFAIASAKVFKQSTTLDVAGNIRITVSFTGQAVSVSAFYTAT